MSNFRFIYKIIIRTVKLEILKTSYIYKVGDVIHNNADLVKENN